MWQVRALLSLTMKKKLNKNFNKRETADLFYNQTLPYRCWFFTITFFFKLFATVTPTMKKSSLRQFEIMQWLLNIKVFNQLKPFIIETDIVDKNIESSLSIFLTNMANCIVNPITNSIFNIELIELSFNT